MSGIRGIVSLFDANDAEVWSSTTWTVLKPHAQDFTNPHAAFNRHPPYQVVTLSKLALCSCQVTTWSQEGFNRLDFLICQVRSKKLFPDLCFLSRPRSTLEVDGPSELSCGIDRKSGRSKSLSREISFSSSSCIERCVVLNTKSVRS